VSLFQHVPGPLRSRSVRAAFGAALLVGLSCGSARTPHPDAGWPSGALLSARRAPLLRLLEQLEQLAHTPLARQAGALRAALPDCDEIEAQARDGAAGLPDALRCAAPSGPLAGLRRYRGEDSLALAIPAGGAPGDGPRVLLRARHHEETLHAQVHWPDAATGGLLASLLPGEKAAGAPLLARADRVLHARVRSPGLDLAALVPEGSQGDDLFHLKGELLSRALLDGSWELAMYPPTERAQMPRIALALGVRLRRAAETGMQRLLDELEQSWSLRHTPVAFSFAEGAVARGACLPELKLLPELAPCAVTTDAALVLGWNAASLRHALDTGGAPEAALGFAGQAELDLSALERADLRLAAAGGEPSPDPVTRWPWRGAKAWGERRGDATAVWIELVSSQRENGR
jgi:hypothetical protein